jgi:ATP-dependent Clp endopeptidase proteolytic subunit ClpP
MKIVKESIDRFFDYDLHIETRTIYIGDGEDGSGVGPKMAEKVIKAFIIFNATPEKPVRIILNTKGGDIFDGYAVYDAIKASPCHVTIEVMGSAMSMGSIILQAADERLIHPHSTVMIHDGHDSMEMNIRDIEKWAEFYKKVDRPRMYALFAEKTGKPAHYWEKKAVNDYVMTAQQAVDEGLADRVVGTEEEEEPHE